MFLLKYVWNLNMRGLRWVIPEILGFGISGCVCAELATSDFVLFAMRRTGRFSQNFISWLSIYAGIYTKSYLDMQIERLILVVNFGVRERGSVVFQCLDWPRGPWNFRWIDVFFNDGMLNLHYNRDEISKHISMAVTESSNSMLNLNANIWWIGK